MLSSTPFFNGNSTFSPSDFCNGLLQCRLWFVFRWRDSMFPQKHKPIFPHLLFRYIIDASQKKTSISFSFSMLFGILTRLFHVQNINKTMSFWTWHFPVSTLACVHRVELDIGKQKLKKLRPSNVEFDSFFTMATPLFRLPISAAVYSPMSTLICIFVDVMQCFLKKHKIP